MMLDAALRVELGEFRLDVDLHARGGEVVAVLGANGAGKTTLLRCISGLQPIDAGRIELGGRVVDDPGRGVFVPPEQRGVGVVFQGAPLFARMNALDNVAYPARARRVPRREARLQAERWLASFGLADVAARRAGDLSGGQAQRVALARALAGQPHLLLLDEPFAALDASIRAGVRREIRAHLEHFAGPRLLVTHDPVDVYSLADRVVILEGGRVAQHGTLAEVTARPRSRFVADLVGVNLLSGTVGDGVLTTARGARVVVADASPGPAFVAIRPASLALSREAPHSSVRNVWAGRIADLERLGDRVRVSLDGQVPLTAEITVAALDALALRAGEDVFASCKATDIEVYPR